LPQATEGNILKNRKNVIAALTLTLGVGAALGGFCLKTGNCQPPAKETTVVNPVSTTIKQEKIRWYTSMDEAIQQAATEDKLIFVDFHATWCPPCKLMEQETFSNKEFIVNSEDWVMAKIDVDKDPDTAAKYGIEGLPTLAVLHSDGKPVAGVSGYHNAGELKQFMQAARAQAGKE
jgi:thiol:disulfide interchange protein